MRVYRFCVLVRTFLHILVTQDYTLELCEARYGQFHLLCEDHGWHHGDDRAIGCHATPPEYVAQYGEGGGSLAAAHRHLEQEAYNTLRWFCAHTCLECLPRHGLHESAAPIQHPQMLVGQWHDVNSWPVRQATNHLHSHALFFDEWCVPGKANLGNLGTVLRLLFCVPRLLPRHCVLLAKPARVDHTASEIWRQPPVLLKIEAMRGEKAKCIGIWSGEAGATTDMQRDIDGEPIRCPMWVRVVDEEG
jgi:hypothetical protein